MANVSRSKALQVGTSDKTWINIQLLNLDSDL